MKNAFYLLASFLLIGLNSFSQATNKIDESTTIKKGQITLKDGQTVDFENLKMNNEIVTYSDPADANGSVTEQKASDVLLITKQSTMAGDYALYFGACGLGGALGALIGYPGVDFGFAVGLTAGMTVGFAAIGGLFGSMIPKQRVVFENNSSISFSPSFDFNYENNYCPGISIKYTF